METYEYTRRLETDLAALEELITDYVHAGCEDLKDSIPEIEQRRRERREMKQAVARTLAQRAAAKSQHAPAGKVGDHETAARRKTPHEKGQD